MTYTKLVSKHYSPLVLRKYTHWGFPLYVAIITDDDLSNLDNLVVDFMKKWQKEQEKAKVIEIQDMRNIAGELSDYLLSNYEKSEGIAVIIYADKMFVSSLHGDFMTHLACKLELYQLLNMSIGV